MPLKSILDFAKFMAGAALDDGARAVDATAGNGHDTLFLAREVGAEGSVWAFDVQERALRATRRRLQEAGLSERAVFLQQGHERMRTALPAEAVGAVRAVMFNLGYLPGGPDKSVITTPETTLPALEAALELLAVGGVLTVVCYTGHPGGREEAGAVHAWAEALDQQHYQALSYAFVNQQGAPPQLLVVEKQKARSA